jgi:hypothetical protein
MLDRRSFIGMATTAAAAPPLGNAREQSRSPRAVIVREDGFPSVDGGLSPDAVAAALRGLEVSFADTAALGALDRRAADLLVLPYGSAFPKAAWQGVLGFLADGGNLLVLGGVPFAVPVTRDGAQWRQEQRLTHYHKRLGLTHAFPVRAEAGVRVLVPDAGGVAPPEVRRAYAGYWRFTRTKAVPAEDGSDGEREAVIAPLVALGEGHEAAAMPVVQVDRLLGPFAGGRWVFAMYEGTYPAALLRMLAERAATGVRRLEVRPTYACYRASETPRVVVSLRSGRAESASCAVRVVGPDGREVAAASLALPAEGAIRTTEADLRAPRGRSHGPGLYRVEAGCGDLTAVTGFWKHDAGLLDGGPVLTADAHTLLRNGEPFPATGTTYMAGDVHRRFLFEPNPAVWDRDFAAMRAAGCNIVRTGIWTAWQRCMPPGGGVDEGVLRAFEAFILTARRHDLPVIFTFFAFIPETWGGANAYLDPQALRAQEAFVTAFAERVRTANAVIWDLINEPSFCNPQRLWSCRPNYDAHEAAAWAAWLRATYPEPDDERFLARMAERWRLTPGEPLDLPPLDEFGDRNLWEQARPLRTTAYRRFAQDAFAGWARRLAGALRRVNPRQLVMVGQDEGGTGESPSNQLFGADLDATSIHTWWLNDDLVWDHVVSRPPGKPNLAQETGIMFVETLDGVSWRTETEARDLLERKFAIALGVGAAGYIQWIWNINTTMPLDNESTIGLHRPDGSAKPEFAAWRGVNRFGAALARVGPRQNEEVVLVIPHGNLWSSRNQATDATKRGVRVMAYHCRVPLAGVSEFTLDRLASRPRLLVVPSPRMLSEAAWRRLLELARGGATVLVTGPFEADEYLLAAPRLPEWGVRADVRPVTQAEDLVLGDERWRLSYRGDRMARVEKAVVEGEVATLRRFAAGRGQLLWCPLPVELAAEVEPAAALYRAALASAGVRPGFTVRQGDDPAVLMWRAGYRDAVLYTLVSERAEGTDIELRDGETGAVVRARLPGQRAAMVLVGRTGQELARYGGDAVMRDE